jgi:signal transduction histidine kinase/ABC-type uncharacterized transport system substrate-binding protein
MIKKQLNRNFIVILMIFIGSFNMHPQGLSEQKVLLLNSYHPQYNWTNNFTQGIENVLMTQIKPECLYIEYLDGRHMMDNEIFFRALVDFYKQKYVNVKFDAVMTTDDYALEFLMKYKEDIFHDAPVIFGGINDMSKIGKLDPLQYTGVFEGLPVLENLNLIIKAQKGVNKIVILSDLTTQGKEVTAKAREVIKRSKNPGIKIELHDNFSFEQIKEEMKNADKHTAYLILVIIRDIKGRYFSFQQDLPILSASSKAPIYGMWGSLLIGNGSIGGYINDPYTHGQEIGEMTKQILQGAKTKDIPIRLQTIYKPRFDYLQMKKFGFDKKLLPKDAIVYFEPESYYQKHKAVIQTGISLLLALLLLIFLLCFIIRKQRKYNLALNTITKELKQSNDNLHQFSYMTSHQLRSSAVNIDMLLNYYKEEPLDDNEKSWVWDKIRVSSSLIQNTVDDIAKILAIQKQKIINDFKNVTIQKVCDTVMLSYQELIHKGDLKVNFKLEEQPTIITNENILKDIITILIENAIKYRPENRLLVIDVTTQLINKELHLSIQDNGDGLPNSYQKKLFQLYQRGHEHIEGKGLGLYMARLLTYSINAHIEYKNNKGGPTFTLVFNQ